MNLLQSGVPKSGNFWLYKIIQNILTLDNRSTISFIERQPIYEIARTWDLNFPDQARIDVLEVTDLQYSYRISSIFQMPLDNIENYVRQSPHIWTHSPVCKRSDELFRLFDKKVYIIRDPRDRALSAAKYYCSEYMLKYFPQEETEPDKFLNKNFDYLMHEWVWHVFDHLRYSREFNIHISFYEGFLLNFQEELNSLLNYLGISLKNSQKEALQEAVSFNTLKKKNPDHLKKGQSGYWMDQLTDEQVEKTNIIAGPLLRHLNYPLSRNAEDAELLFPEFKNTGLERLKDEILESQQQLAIN